MVARIPACSCKDCQRAHWKTHQASCNEHVASRSGSSARATTAAAMQADRTTGAAIPGSTSSKKKKKDKEETVEIAPVQSQVRLWCCVICGRKSRGRFDWRPLISDCLLLSDLYEPYAVRATRYDTQRQGSHAWGRFCFLVYALLSNRIHLVLLVYVYLSTSTTCWVLFDWIFPRCKPGVTSLSTLHMLVMLQVEEKCMHKRHSHSNTKCPKFQHNIPYILCSMSS